MSNRKKGRKTRLWHINCKCNKNHARKHVGVQTKQEGRRVPSKNTSWKHIHMCVRYPAQSMKGNKSLRARRLSGGGVSLHEARRGPFVCLNKLNIVLSVLCGILY